MKNETKTVVKVCLGLVLTAVLLIGCAVPASTPAPKPAPIPPPATTATPKPATTPSPAPVAPATPAQVSTADFFKNNVVTLLVNSTAGGATDFSGRTFASFWTEATGGAMVVKNEPGGSGLVAGNMIYSTVKPDGLTLGWVMLAPHMLLPTIFEDPGVKFDATKFGFIGEMDPIGKAFSVGAKQPWTTMSDIQAQKGLVIGGDNPSGATTLTGALLIEFFGLKDAKIATGFRGAELPLAAARGELAGYAMSTTTMLEDYKKGHVKKPFLVMGFKRDPVFPDVPALTETIKLSPEYEKWLSFADSITGSRVIFAPPSISADRLQFLRSAFEKLTRLPGYREQMKRVYPISMEPVSGEEVKKKVEVTLTTPAQLTRALKEKIRQYMVIK